MFLQTHTFQSIDLKWLIILSTILHSLIIMNVQINKKPVDKPVEIDIVSRKLSYGEKDVLVNIPDGVREQLVQGTWDSLGQLIDASDQVVATAKGLPYTSNFSL